jgi:asparaginyl-tRNA synthetase
VLSNAIRPPGSWQQPDTHFRTAMNSPWYQGVVQLQDSITNATMQFWSARGLRYGHLPITTGSVSSPMGVGSDSSPVQVDMHGVPTYLADSMQFSLEYLCRLSPAGSYYLMPSFRGEAPDATHLCQFFHSEAEIPGGLDEILLAVEEYLRHLTGYILDRHADLITAMAGGTRHMEQLLIRSPALTRLTFDEAVGLLEGQGSVYTDELGRWRTLTRTGERQVMERAGQFTWITHWDHLAVPFYQANDGTGTRALNADLLFGPGEIIGAGERHATGGAVREALKAHDVDVNGYEWYVTMKNITPMRTAGFGLGVERFLMWLAGSDDIRDFQLLPRVNGQNIIP